MKKLAIAGIGLATFGFSLFGCGVPVKEEVPPQTPTPEARIEENLREYAPARSEMFAWPAIGYVTAYLGIAHPLGIDIEYDEDINQPVFAADVGRVVFAGGNRCCSYGYYVVISHPDGWETLYSHMNIIEKHVQPGYEVRKCEKIGVVGRTGYATGNHLHFEVHFRGEIINPLSALSNEACLTHYKTR